MMYKLLYLISALISPVVMYEQNDYTMDFERLEVITYNKKYVNYIKTTTFKYNRNQPALNVTVDLAYALERNIQVIVQAYKFASNEYRLFPIRFGFNLCTSMENNDFGLSSVFQHGNFSGCPMKTERFCVTNWIPDQNKFPPHIPNGSYRVDFQLMFFSEELATFQGYGTVSRPLGRRH